jgi:cell division transport system permease protein
MASLLSPINAHLIAFKRAAVRLIQQPAVTALSVVVIAIALAFPLGLFAVFENVLAATGRLQINPGMNVYLQPALSDAEAKDVGEVIKKLPLVESLKFESREAALAKMKGNAGMQDVLAGLETNPLPHAFLVQPKVQEGSDKAAAEILSLREQIQKIPGVEYVIAEFEWAKKLNRLARFAKTVLLLVAFALCGAVVVVTGNTIRLQILTQRDEIEISQLIGATNTFVRRPFLYFGAAQGALAGGLAWLMVWATLRWAAVEVQELAKSYGSDFSLLAISPSVGFTLVFLAMLLGWLGALLSVEWYLRRISTA